MSDSEKPLKVISGVVSGMLVVSALLYFVFALGNPKKAEAALEYSAPPGFEPSELTSVLNGLRKDQRFLEEVATRSKFAKTSDPQLGEAAARLGSRLAFEANLMEPTVSIRFAHPKASTAIEVTNAAAEVAKERLELQQKELAKEIIILEDAVLDKRKLLEFLLRREANPATGSQNEEEGWRCLIAPPPLIDVKADLEQGLRKLEVLKTKRLSFLGPIRAATRTSD